MQNLIRQNNSNYNQYYTPSMNQYPTNKNKENFYNLSNNNTRAFSPNINQKENKYVNSKEYSYLNNKEIPLKNSNKLNIQAQRNPHSYQEQSYKQNFPDSSNSQNYFSPIPKQIPENINLNYINSVKNNYPISKNYNNKKNKKTLILDLDETLVHSGFHPFNRKSDFTLNIKVDGKNHTIYVLKRPYVEEFLSEIAPYFEIIIFTASISEYASPLIDMLDKNKLTSGRLFRQHCLFNHGLYLKDIKIIQKDLKDVIIIDNNPVSYVMNQDNGIPILTWYDDLNDKELLNIIPFLKYLSTENDVREVIKNVVDKQTNKIRFEIVDDLIKKKINDNNKKSDLIYPVNNNNKNNINKNNINDALRKRDDFNIKSNYKENYINNNNYNENKYEIKLNKKFNNEEEENRIKNYFNNENNFYKYNNYNNSIHDSLSNMTYNEIQNEGTINEDKEEQNNYNVNSNYNNKNDYNKRNQNYIIQKAVNYDNHRHYEEKNKKNNFNNANQLLNNEKGNIEKKEIRAKSNSNYKYKINNMNNYAQNNIAQEQTYKNYSSNTYNPNTRKMNYKYNNVEQRFRSNNSVIPNENKNNNNYEEQYMNNIYNQELRKDKIYDRIKSNNYINENNKYLENLTMENNEKEENLKDNYLKLYQQQLLKLREDERNFQNYHSPNNNVNNIHIYQNKNMNSPFTQNLNYPNTSINRNHSINSLNYRRNNMNFINFNNNVHNVNNNYNQKFFNDIRQNDMIKREEKNIFKDEEQENNVENDRQRMTTNLRFFKTQTNFLQSYKDRNKNMFNINNNYNQNNNFRFNNNFRRNNEEKDEKIIQPKINNYFNNNDNELNRSFSGKKILPNNKVSNIDLDRKARERKKYDFTPHYMNRKEANETNKRNINLNNKMNHIDYMNQRNDTDVYKDKGKDNLSINDLQNQINNADYRNKIFNYSRENNFNTNNVIEKLNNLKQEYKINNNNPSKYSQKLSKTDERKFYRSSSSKPNSYNFLYNNDNSRIPRSYNNININNYNFYNSFIGNNKYKNDENRFYNNKYRMHYFSNRNEEQENELNRSSSYFHPKVNYYSLLNRNGNSYTPNALKRNNFLKAKFLNNFGNYRAFE